MRELSELLREGRARERAQTRFYRHLSSQAETAGHPELAERLNELLADEQHHVSRLTARLLEMGGRPADPPEAPSPDPSLDGWEEEARSREEGEVAWYRKALDEVDDPTTRGVLREILEAEEHHLEELGGKWMAASPPPPPDDTSDEGETE